MTIAIPVKDENLTLAGNAGHTPKFAIFTVNGAGMFRSFTLDKVIDNPRSDMDHNHDNEEHECDHDAPDHIAQHEKMGDVLKACSYLVVKRACKNTALSMQKQGIKIVKYNGDAQDANIILKELSASFV